MCDFRSAPEWSSWVPMIPVPTSGVGHPGVVVHNPGFVPSETNVFGQAIR
jgi:hypothetical protein